MISALKKTFCVFLLLASFIGVKSQSTASLQVDFGKEVGPMKIIWSWFGADDPNYAYMKDGQKLLTELGSLSKNPVYFRTHNLMTSGDADQTGLETKRFLSFKPTGETLSKRNAVFIGIN